LKAVVLFIDHDSLYMSILFLQSASFHIYLYKYLASSLTRTVLAT